MKSVKKIYFRNSEAYDKLYQGSELLFKVNKVVWKGLTFTAIEPSTIKYTKSSVTTAQYSYDAVNWVTADGVTLSLNTGDKVYFKGNITGVQSDSSYAKFEMTGKVEASGSIMSLQAGNPEDKTIKYNYEFYKLFDGCSSLTTAPELPATTLTERCYMNLFVGCGLTEPTALPATTLAVRCYQNLFNGCKSLIYGPELPATKMAENCYANMFLNCTSLTTAPELPSTTLDVGCYQGMFYTCTSLTTAPELPATTLKTDCYKNMFGNCSKLNYIKALFTTTPSSSYTANWVKGVASSGTFVKNKDATWDLTGVNGVPSGWEIQSVSVWKGLTFKALEPSTIKYTPTSQTTAQYSYDNVNWSYADNKTLNLNTGDKVYFKGSVTGWQLNNYANFVMTGKIKASGSIMSMQSGNPEDKTLKYNSEFCRLFRYCTSLVTAPELPATTLTDSCYDSMFEGCTSLITTPELPATTLIDFCYRWMFSGCTSLVNVTELKATTLKICCYQAMFKNCTSLTNAPKLPATTLTDSCYSNMFFGCSSLVNSPDLPATTLGENCYNSMFYGCTSLTKAPTLHSTTLKNKCYNGMFYGCSSLVNSPDLPATTLADGCYSKMFENCTSLTTAPVLPATTLVTGCYSYMFYGCSSLNYIKALFTTEPSSTYTNEWVKGVASSGTFVKNSEATWDVTGVNGIPSGWEIQSMQEYDELLVSGRYNFKIPKGDGAYYVIDTKNDCEADIISDSSYNSVNRVALGSASQGDYYEWELFYAGYNLYFDLSFQNSRRLYWRFGTINANTKYTIGGSNGNYLGTDRALYVNGSKKVSSTTLSTYNNTSDVVFFGENVTDFYVGNIKIYESTGLVYHIVPIIYNGNIEFYDKVNKRFMEITYRPDSAYSKTKATGEKVII